MIISIKEVANWPPNDLKIYWVYIKEICEELSLSRYRMNMLLKKEAYEIRHLRNGKCLCSNDCLDLIKKYKQ